MTWRILEWLLNRFWAVVDRFWPEKRLSGLRVITIEFLFLLAFLTAINAVLTLANWSFGDFWLMEIFLIIMAVVVIIGLHIYDKGY